MSCVCGWGLVPRTAWEACARGSLLELIGSAGIRALCSLLQHLVKQEAPQPGTATGNVALLMSRVATFQRVRPVLAARGAIAPLVLLLRGASPLAHAHAACALANVAYMNGAATRRPVAGVGRGCMTTWRSGDC